MPFVRATIQSKAPNGSPSNSNPSPPQDANPLALQSAIMSSSYPITLQFIDLGYKVKVESKNGGNLRRMFTGGPTCSSDQRGPTETIRERVILNGVTGTVSPGEILAILGPSGSGKSTLLNALAGRLQDHCLTGTVLANGRRPTKAVLKRTGFVTQDDVLYPHLTVRETLIYCSLLRLPNSLSKDEKIAIVENVIRELGLEKCQDTIIGNSFIRGVSGGERKRVSIGHEMLVNPSLLLLDEPTSGLDSTAAHRLMVTLGSLAQKGKTVVTSVHQPSSQVYQMFHSVLVMCEGRCIYFGKGSDAMEYFRSIGFSPSFPMNPADFLLDLANGLCQVDGVGEKDKPSVKQFLVSSYNKMLAPKVKAICMDANNGLQKEKIVGSPALDVPSRSNWTRCCSSWFNQFSILLQRGFKERRNETFNSLRVFQVLAASLLAGSMWWHSDFRDIQDRLGLLFFFSIFWGVFPSFNAVFAFPLERAIFMKERASGMYSLSSYFMARIVGDMPMELILPTLFLIIAYWMAGLKPELGAFLLTIAVILGYVLVSQGLGLALGAMIMDAKQASTLVTVTMLAFVLTGGFYVHKMPYCMGWLKYVSTTFYAYRLLINVHYGQGEKISSLFGCSHYGNRTATCAVIQDDIEGQIHPATSLLILLFMFVGYRLLAYIALKRIKV